MSKYAREVYAFEPAVFNFNILEKNIIENYGKGLIENNVVPLNIALSSSTEIGSFNYGSLEEGTSVHMLGAAVNQHGRQFAPKLAQKMLAMRLDDMVKIFRAPVPNHIKIDVDGSELDVIRGAKETLLNRDVKSVLVEITYANRGQETRRLVEESGFELAKKSERSSEFANHIFFRK
jgi:FkbM family methyltransferase